MRAELAKYLGLPPENITFFWKGRVALYAILKAAGIEPGDEIILPGFTCVVVVNPIIYLQAKPVYVDINPLTYTLDVAKIESKITDKTKAILAQNTFGLAPDLDAIIKIARKHNLLVIEDCAHGFGGSYKGKPNGTVADASFFSTQWNKPFTTGIGGFAVARETKIADKLRLLEATFRKPSFKDAMTIKTLLFLHEKLGSNFYWPAIKTYRWLSRNNLILGSSQREELETPVMPINFEKGISFQQLKKGRKELVKFGENLIHHRQTADTYKKLLTELSIKAPIEPDYAVHSFLKFPLLVKNRDKFFRDAEQEKIEIGDWFLSPLHPIMNNLEVFHYQWGSNPIAERISQHIINLPTHRNISEEYIVHLREFLHQQRNNVFSSYEELLEFENNKNLV